MPEIFFLGLGGVARSGKDTFFKILKSLLEDESLSVVRISFADQLKKEFKDFSIKEFNINPISCKKKEKELIRPLLVEFGKAKRKITNGRYWIEKLDNKIQNFSVTKKTLFVITDVRFNCYDKDEVDWVKTEKNGAIAHISQYEEFHFKNRISKTQTGSVKIYIHPANEEEKKNDPMVKKNANYIIEWPKLGCSDQELFDNLKTYVDQFIFTFKKDQPSFFSKKNLT